MTTASQVPVLTIDGPSGSGKGTIARRVAQELGWHLLDSGALYRLVALSAERGGVAQDAESALGDLAAGMAVRFDANEFGEERIWLGAEDVTAAIRSEKSGLGASHVAALPAVRAALIGLQKSFRQSPGLVADGRDMGSLIFPDAEVKVFLMATPAERAKRRYKQLKGKGIDVSLPALARDIEDRDKRDSERSIAPLRPASDARVLDSSELTIDEVTRIVLHWVHEGKVREDKNS